MKKISSMLCLVVVVVIIIGTFVSASAAEKYIYNKLIDSNSYTFVTAPLKENPLQPNALVQVIEIYTVNGTVSSCKKLNVKINFGGTATTATKGVYKDIPIPSNFLIEGINVPLYAMSVDPAIDYRVDIYWNIH